MPTSKSILQGNAYDPLSNLSSSILNAFDRHLEIATAGLDLYQPVTFRNAPMTKNDRTYFSIMMSSNTGTTKGIGGKRRQLISPGNHSDNFDERFKLATVGLVDSQESRGSNLKSATHDNFMLVSPRTVSPKSVPGSYSNN